MLPPVSLLILGDKKRPMPVGDTIRNPVGMESCEYPKLPTPTSVRWACRCAHVLLSGKIADTNQRPGALIHEQGWGDAASEERLSRDSHAVEAANGVPAA